MFARVSKIFGPIARRREIKTPGADNAISGNRMSTPVKRGCLVVFIAALCLVIGGGQHPSAQTGYYTLVDIVDPHLLGVPALDINDNGVVVGGGVGNGQGFIWTQAGGGQPIPIYAAQIAPFFRMRISNDGVVAGVGCGGGSVPCQAEIWRADFGEIPLGNSTFYASSINDQGQVVGLGCCTAVSYVGFIWSSATGLQNLFPDGQPNDINAVGQIVGGAYCNGSGSMSVWSATGGLIATIPVLPNATCQEGLRINDSGVVVGRTFLAPDNHGGMFRWSPQGGTEDLNALGAPAGSVYLGMDINNAGDIVVSLNPPITGGEASYLYSHGVWTNINDLVPPGSRLLGGVTAINNRGWIVGSNFLLIPPNRTPTATDDDVSVLEDVAANGTLSATDPDSDPLTYSIVTNGTKGSATITNAATGAFTYTPNPNANGADSFTFIVNDGAHDSNVATETVTIAAVNDAPVAANGTASVNSGSSASGTLVATDIDSLNLTYVIVTNGTKGTATITDAGTGAYTYAANAGSSGGDTFTFRANDGALDSNVGTIGVTITASCAANISSSVALSQGPIKTDKKTGRYTQVVTLKNSDGAVAGPVSLVLDSLSPNASLVGASGTTVCAAPSGSAYVNVDVGADGLFSPRERATVMLEFVNPSAQPITYMPRVLAGVGTR